MNVQESATHTPCLTSPKKLPFEMHAEGKVEVAVHDTANVVGACGSATVKLMIEVEATNAPNCPVSVRSACAYHVLVALSHSTFDLLMVHVPELLTASERS